MNNNLELIAIEDNLIGTLEGISSLDLQLGTQKKGLEQPIEQPIYNSFPYASWGTDNLAPRHYDEKIEQNTALSGALNRKIDKFLAGGIEYGFLDDKRVFTATYNEEIEEFMEQPEIIQYLNNSFFNYARYYGCPAKMAFNEPKTKLLHFISVPAGEIRWEKQDKNTGVINNAYWSKNWHLGVGMTQGVIKLPAIDELYHKEEYIRENQTDFHYIYRPQIPGPSTYYQVPMWYPSVLQGWHEHSMQIPKWYTKMMENTTSVQFQVIFRQNYFKILYGEKWEKGNVEQKAKIMKEKLQEIKDCMLSPENAGKFLATMEYMDPQTNQMTRGYEIEAIDLKTFSGEHLKNMAEADQHIIWSVGEDPIGMGSHGSGSDGSGSGKKAAFNGDIATNTRHANVILAPFYFAKRFNNWDKRLKFRIALPYLADLNQVTPDKRNNGYPDQNKKSDASTDNNNATGV